MNPEPVSVYRLDPRHVLRLLGLRLVIAAVLVGVAALLLAFDQGPVRVVAYLVGAAAMLLVVLAVVPLVRPPAVVRLDGEGYRVRRVRDCGVRAATWPEVRRVDDKAGYHGPTLVLELEAGGSTYVPLLLVARQARRLQGDVHERLNRAHGYRRLPSDAGEPGEADWHRPEST